MDMSSYWADSVDLEAVSEPGTWDEVTKVLAGECVAR